MIPVDARGGDPFTGTNCPLENGMRTVAGREVLLKKMEDRHDH